MADDFEFVPPTTPIGPDVPLPVTETAGAGRKSRLRTISVAAIGTAAAAALAVGGVSVASAQSSGSSSTTPTTVAPGAAPTPGTPGAHHGPGGFRDNPGFGGLPGGFGGPGGLGGGGRGSIHGEFVEANGTGYQTVDTQTGTVVPKGVSSTSIEVKSADGFDKTYVVGSNTVVNSGQNGIGTVSPGDTVSVVAIVSGNAAQAKSVIDLTTLKAIGGHWNPLPAGGSTPGVPGTSPPSTPPTSVG